VRGRGRAATAAALTLVVAACGGGGNDEGRRTGANSGGAGPPLTTPTTVKVAISPLTGMLDNDGASLTRSSLAVKIENTPEARPQSGLDVADVVYEEVVEGSITRFWAIFNSTVPPNVGPIRSVRLMDPGIVSPFGGVVAFSGGTGPNVALIRATPTVAIDESNAADAFYRDSKRFAPHNLYGDTSKLFGRGGQPVPPKPVFSYLSADQAAGGSPVSQFRVGFSSGYDPTYVFDAAKRVWLRHYGTTPFKAVSGEQVAPANVIVQYIRYPANSEGVVIGEGDAWVFVDGFLVKGRWSKPDNVTPTAFTDAAGQVVRLRPGRTWVELLPVGSAVDVTPAPAPPPGPVPVGAR
jgi:hypothetical protein